MILVLKIGIEQIEHCPYDYDDCQQDGVGDDHYSVQDDDVGDDHYSVQDDDVGDDQRCWGMQVGGQKQTPATPL